MPPKLNNKENKKQNFLKLKILNLICYSQINYHVPATIKISGEKIGNG